MADPTATGFDGLSAFSTDVEGAIAAADRIATRPRRADPSIATKAAPAAPVHSDANNAWAKKVGAWILACVMILVVKTCIWGGVHTVNDGGSPTASASSAQSDQPSGYAADSAETASTIDNMADEEILGNDVQPEDASEAAPVTPAYAPEASSEDDTSLSKPMPGYATLSVSEIRYCLAEDIRLDAQKAAIDILQFSDSDRYNRNVDRFNDAVSDYNSRCYNRSVMSNERMRATSQVEQQRMQLETEGRGRVE